MPNMKILCTTNVALAKLAQEPHTSTLYHIGHNQRDVVPNLTMFTNLQQSAHRKMTDRDLKTTE